MKIKRGFKAVKEEEERREKAREQAKGKLWRLFFPKDADEDYEIPFIFLTDEPLCYHEHNRKINGKFTNIPCTGDGCTECDEGDKPRFVGAFLGIDRTEFEVKERKDGKETGKKKKVKDRLKLLVRGQQDLAKLDRLNKKYGLLDIEWSIAKTGSDTTTTWNFDRGDEHELTNEELLNILPEKYREKPFVDKKGNIDFYAILEEQIMGSDEEEDDEDEEEVTKKVTKGVQSLEDDEDEEDDEEEEDEPVRKKSSKKPLKSSNKKTIKKRK